MPAISTARLRTIGGVSALLSLLLLAVLGCAGGGGEYGGGGERGALRRKVPRLLQVASSEWPRTQPRKERPS